MKWLNCCVYLIIFISGDLMAGTLLAGDFLAHIVTFGDFMAGNFLAGDFLGGYRLFHMTHIIPKSSPDSLILCSKNLCLFWNSFWYWTLLSGLYKRKSWSVTWLEALHTKLQTQLGLGMLNSTTTEMWWKNGTNATLKLSSVCVS